MVVYIPHITIIVGELNAVLRGIVEQHSSIPGANVYSYTNGSLS